jgi:hypothetical protein
MVIILEIPSKGQHPFMMPQPPVDFIIFGFINISLPA